MGLLAIRKKRGLTQVQLAKRVGLEQAQISQLERADDPNVGWHIVRRLATALNVRPQDLFSIRPRSRPLPRPTDHQVHDERSAR